MLLENVINLQCRSYKTRTPSRRP